MTKHITDTPHEHSGSRLREYTRKERQDGTHPSIDALRKRPHDRDENSRKSSEYTQIDRDQQG